MEQVLKMGDYAVQTHCCHTVVVGTGAAGFGAADCLVQEGQSDVVIVTEHLYAGTSRNTGSDKQTYYKLTVSGGEPDSVKEMSQTLFAGKCVDEEHALCEAALSSRCFYKLVELGVPFPHNRYGEYIGYKTDHDPRCRATSAGPYTSKMMTECLQQAVEKKKIPIFDRLQVIEVLRHQDHVVGLLCLHLAEIKQENRFVAFRCENVVFATGGPAGIYAHSVYPNGHYGASGVAFAAGVQGKNLTEWQYGMASVKPRWNVSGTYMQVLPKFISTNQEGGDQQEFLKPFFEDKSELLNRIFLKGYQWPFDVHKIANGSSLIDLIVYEEQRKGRRIFLDFRENPDDKAIAFETLSEEVFSYLDKAGACFGTPIERLAQMNQPAIDFYKDKGVDLHQEPLEIAVCAQHNNGGLSVDLWWQTNLNGFFAVGEVAATHGVYRPGGSALNAGQVGAMRAAQYIAACRTQTPGIDETFLQTLQQVGEIAKLGEECLSANGDSNLEEHFQKTTCRMSACGGAIRNQAEMEDAISAVQMEREQLATVVHITGVEQMGKLYRYRDILLCQQVYLEAMLDYIKHGGKSRGSALYTDENGILPHEKLSNIFSFCLDDGALDTQVQEAVFEQGQSKMTWRSVRRLPEQDDFFENVWRTFRQNKNIG